MTKIIISTFILASVYAFSQNQVQQSLQDVQYRSVDLSRDQKIDAYYDGTPYIYPYYVLGKIEGYPETYKFRYNAFLDEVDFLKDGAELSVMKDPAYKTIYFTDTNEIIKLENYTYKDKAYSGYLFLLENNGDVNIFKKIQTEYLPAKKARSSYDTDSPPTFKQKSDVYFIQKGNSPITELPTNRKKLIDMFPDKKEAVNKLLQGNKMDYSNKNDLKRLAEIL